MRHDRIHRSALVIGALLAASAPQRARADLLIPLDEGAVVIKDHRAIITSVGSTETLIDEIGVRSTARRLLWIRPFPHEPKQIAPGKDKPFDQLSEFSVVRSPYNELIRDNLFGPSIVTVLVDRLFREPADPLADLGDNIEPRALEIGPLQIFSGPVTSSTITNQLYLPETMGTFLKALDVDLDQKTIADMAIALNRGWVVMATIIEDPAPAVDRPATIGPIGFRFRTPIPMYPMATRRSATGVAVPFEFFVVADAAMVSNAYETTWDVRPWEKMRTRTGHFLVDYNDAIAKETPVAIELVEQLGLSLPQNPRLVHSKFRHPRGVSREILFVKAKDPVAVPSGTRRGSGFDLFLCILLGLAPLLYTPESWFLLWIASRARGRNPDGGGVATKLWSFYAIIVGVYWFIVLPDAARIAGIVPILIGVLQLGLPYTAREAAPVRVDFKRRSKAKS